ncbi:MAG: DUF1257 domain-containing protein [Caldilineaceae bacterium]|nr:DUF1257 domain-containing protein [Caldilineaceae bacterium]
MSKFVRVQTALRDLSLVKRSLEDLKLDYQENAQYVHIFSGFKGKVPLVVKQNRVQFALREAADETYEVIGDDMQMATINKLMGQVQQRYAYHKVLEETSKAGFSLVEEQVGNDQVIRMTVRRWG